MNDTGQQLEQAVPSETDILLATVIMKLHDTIALFQDLAQRSHLPAVQQHAFREIKQRREFDTALQAELRGPTRQVPDGTFTGLFLRVSKDIQSLFPGAERNMLSTVDDGETALRAAYYLALEQCSASAKLREEYQRQQTHVHRAQTQLGIFREQI